MFLCINSHYGLDIFGFPILKLSFTDIRDLSSVITCIVKPWVEGLSGILLPDGSEQHEVWLFNGSI